MKKILFSSLLSLSIVSAGALAETKLKLVEVITSPARTAVLRQQVEDFEASNPGIEVEITSLPWGQAFEKACNNGAKRANPRCCRNARFLAGTLC